ncbi:hypothetical protein, partial [Methylibium sp.]|uniref:hypothetical protein n=1 Tax=Methylibium sp. TaxID=2067992 RepID=UPI00179A5637
IDRLEREIERLRAISQAAEKVIRCKGRYHTEQNTIALAALFGVTLPPVHAATDADIDHTRTGD